MKKFLLPAWGVLAAVLLLSGAAFGADKKGDKKAPPPEDPALIGEEVTDQSEYEKTLFTEYRKRRTAHFFFQTSFDMDACKDYIAFCEQQYRDFLKWTGKPADTDLWGTRAQVTLIHNKAEWEVLMVDFTRGQPPHIVEGFKNAGGTHIASPPAVLSYSHEGSDPNNDKMNMFHTINHIFLYGLAGAGHDAHLPWLWEAFSWHRTIEVFGARGSSCFSFETKANQQEDRAWNDIDDWVDLLKRDVRAKQDEDFILFWHKDLMAISTKTYIKGWAIVRYLVRDEKEKEKFVNFISSIKTSKDQQRALKDVYNWSADDLDKAWREWIKGQPNRWRKSSEKKK